MQINGYKINLGLVLAALVAGGALLSWVGFIAADNADTKRRVQVVEERQKEDRKEVSDKIKEQGADIKETKETVNKILIKLESMEQRRRDGR